MAGICDMIWWERYWQSMETGPLHERYAALDRGWRACLIATVIVGAELLVTAV